MTQHFSPFIMIKIISILFSLLIILIAIINLVIGRTILVSTSGQLLKAINSVHPGDVIQLNNGTYRGVFRIVDRNGSPHSMIVLEGNYRSLITNRLGSALHLKRSNYWHFKGFKISNSRKGFVLEKSSNNILESITIENIDEEGMHIYDGSSDNVVKESSILMTGIKSLTNGEAIIVGRDFRHWFAHFPDQSDRNIIINNRLGPGFSNEAVVLNEGTCCGLLSRNKFDGHGMSEKNGYGCWVKIKGDGYRIEHNQGISTINEGFMVMSANEVQMGGCDNVFAQNSCDLQSNGYCIKVVDGHNCGNVVYSDNAYSAGRGLTNIAITRMKRSFKLGFVSDRINFALIAAYTFLPTLLIIIGLILYFRPRFNSTVTIAK